MDESGRLSTLIGDIHDAALDSQRWTGVLARVSVFVGGCASAVYWKDVVARTGGVWFHDGNIDPDYAQFYFDDHVKTDPSTDGHFRACAGDLVSTVDFMSYDEFLKTRFYRDWARPQRLIDGVNAVLDRTAARALLFAVFRHDRNGVVDEDARRRMRLVAPHIRRAVLIGSAIAPRLQEADDLTDALDGLDAGMFLLDEDGRIVHANASGRQMLGESEMLRACGRRLTVVDAAGDSKLRQSIEASAQPEESLGEKGIALPLVARCGTRYVARLLPLNAGERRGRHGGRAVAALFVHKAELQTPWPPEVIARHYRLTPTELRVLLAIVEVGGVPEVAAELGIAETTVKTHLGRLFGKTGVSRQADLVRLVGGYSTPILG
jgi:DNA-binding CsgD family transcriptional regulator/PAS domain-containing protein